MNCLQHVRPGKGYQANFQLFSKVNVNGKDATPLFTWLRESCPRPTIRIANKPVMLWSPVTTTDIEWNFEKFLINEYGRPVRRYSADTLPNTFKQDIIDAIRECEKNYFDRN